MLVQMFNVFCCVASVIIMVGIILNLWVFYDINIRGRKICTPRKRLQKLNFNDCVIETLGNKEEKMYDPKTQEEAVKRVLKMKSVIDELKD